MKNTPMTGRGGEMGGAPLWMCIKCGRAWSREGVLSPGSSAKCAGRIASVPASEWRHAVMDKGLRLTPLGQALMAAAPRDGAREGGS
jgi:hypothetical protein